MLFFTFQYWSFVSLIKKNNKTDRWCPCTYFLSPKSNYHSRILVTKSSNSWVTSLPASSKCGRWKELFLDQQQIDICLYLWVWWRKRAKDLRHRQLSEEVQGSSIYRNKGNLYPLQDWNKPRDLRRSLYLFRPVSARSGATAVENRK